MTEEKNIEELEQIEAAVIEDSERAQGTESVEPEATEAEVDPDLALTRKINGLSKLLQMHYARASKGKKYGDPLHGQGRVLALLTVKPETTQKELLFLLGMKQQSLSELLSKLEAKGFITREKSAEDGRVTVVKLTDAGRAVAPDTSGEREELGVYDCLDAEERARFEKDIDTISDSLVARIAEAEDLESCGGHDDEEEGEQKRHRYGQQGRGASHGGHGKGSGGHGKGSGGHCEDSDEHGKGSGGHGKGAGEHGKGSGGHGEGASGKNAVSQSIADLASAALGTTTLGDIATQVLKEAENAVASGTSSKGSAGHGSGRGGGRGKGRGGRH